MRRVVDGVRLRFAICYGLAYHTKARHSIGWRYRGSGYKQLTGRANYRAIGAIVNMDLEGTPELAREPQAAARIAFVYWDRCGCSPLADAGNLEAITAKVNGPVKLGLAERRADAARDGHLAGLMIAPTAAVTIGMLTVKFHYQTVCTCDVTKAPWGLECRWSCG